MLLVLNDDTPGMIGKVGTLLGEAGKNIADMVVGRHPDGDKAAMCISLDSSLGADLVDRILEMEGVDAAHFVELGPSSDPSEVEH